MLDRRIFMMGLAWAATSDYLLAQQAVLINQVRPKIKMEGVKVDAEYWITCEWSVNQDADVDLHVIVADDADGTDVFYSNSEFHGVSLDHDCKGFTDDFYIIADGKGSSRQIQNLTSKEITTIRGRLPGRFDVGIHLFKYQESGVRVDDHHKVDVPVRVQIIKLNPHTEIMFDANFVLTHAKQCINVNSFVLDDLGRYTEVDVPLIPVSNHAFQSDGELVDRYKPTSSGNSTPSEQSRSVP